MEWINKMNEALKFIENHLNCKIDYCEVAQIGCCSLTRFQRMFIFMADITISEYVRFRRMSEAAKEVVESDIKIYDLAFKYGYESPESFTRAFQGFHGNSPSGVRKSGQYKIFKPIVFSAHLFQDCMLMGDKPVVRIEEITEETAIIFCAKSDTPEKDAWNKMRRWATKNLNDYSARRYFGYAPMGHHPNNSSDNEHEYISTMLLTNDESHDTSIFDLNTTSMPRGLFLVGDVVLNEFDEDGNIDIGESMKSSSQVIYQCMLELKDYELDFDNRTYLEEHLFPREWFIEENHESMQIERKFWLPIRKIMKT
ncbi:helix-turn-helix domain-containing protein [Anaerorhabdus furcosa]|uniref:Helix-turn-helix domain-containing protein n=1 Tax=Anaerorhabdus furcosa TaxID=118967 RepID=A0A1T4L5U7_9FIRM|nr:helix-turn-helix domain-containing protein [Anaerorhabdus furcosa]SJZ50095.1 Helix-turn-helix domain-containing protein [Anaerorhabdus furcosa]